MNPQAGPRPPLVRPREGRMIGGVCLGLSHHLGLPVTTVRATLGASMLLDGFGALLYLWLWAFTPVVEIWPPAGPGPRPGAVPVGGPDAGGVPAGGGVPLHGVAAAPGAVATLGAVAVPVPVPGTGTVPVPVPVPGTPAWPRAPLRRRLAAAIVRGRGSGAPAPAPAPAPGAGPAPARDGGVRGNDLLIGGILLVAGLAMLGARLGYDVRAGVVVPLIVVLGGAVLAYTQLDEVERHRWAARTGVGGPRGAVLRVAGGLALVLTGTLSFLLQSADVVTSVRALVAVLAVLAGTALVLAPWGVRLWRDLDSERAARIREAERADLAAHLHDSVLQTLALIQRQSGDQVAVSRLARSQERDLRDWLYGPRPVDGGTLATEVRSAAADVEDRHGVAVEVVLVGDRPCDDRVGALVAALREAIVNAVRHAGAPVQVYVESGPDGVEAFVRDRGPGFDLATVPHDRLGVRESIIARMQRHGGSATLRSGSGEGTEVRLVLPAGTAPGVGQPAGTAPGVGQPAGTAPGAGQPAGTAPGAGQPAGTAPGAGQPGTVTDSPGQQEGRSP